MRGLEYLDDEIQDELESFQKYPTHRSKNVNKKNDELDYKKSKKNKIHRDRKIHDKN